MRGLVVTGSISPLFHGLLALFGKHWYCEVGADWAEALLGGGDLLAVLLHTLVHHRHAHRGQHAVLLHSTLHLNLNTQFVYEALYVILFLLVTTHCTLNTVYYKLHVT